MAPTVLARTEFRGDDVLLMDGPRYGPDYQLVFDGAGGLETTIAFDVVAMTETEYRFVVLHPHGGMSRTGSIERDDYGAVGDALDAMEAGR